MALKSPRRLTVVITPVAQRDLNQIWNYNCDTYDADHATNYIAFLTKETAKLRTEYLKGKPAPNHPRFRYRVIRKGRGHGYVAIYKILETTVEVLHFYHTAQDWQGKLARDGW